MHLLTLIRKPPVVLNEWKKIWELWVLHIICNIHSSSLSILNTISGKTCQTIFRHLQILYGTSFIQILAWEFILNFRRSPKKFAPFTLLLLFRQPRLVFHLMISNYTCCDVVFQVHDVTINSKHFLLKFQAKKISNSIRRLGISTNAYPGSTNPEHNWKCGSYLQLWIIFGQKTKTKNIKKSEEWWWKMNKQQAPTRDIDESFSPPFTISTTTIHQEILLHMSDPYFRVLAHGIQQRIITSIYYQY